MKTEENWLVFQIEKREQAPTLCDALLRFTPDLLLRDDGMIFLDLRRCQKLYSPAGIVARIRVLLKRLDLPEPKMAFGESASFALLNLRYPPQVRPIESAVDLVDPFSQRPDEHKEIIKKCRQIFYLGIRTVDQLIELPIEEGVTRLGPWFADFFENYSRKQTPEYAAYRSPLAFSETIEFFGDELIENIEVLSFPLKTCVDRLCLRLHGRGLEMAQGIVFLEMDVFPKKVKQYFEFPFSFVLGNPSPQAIHRVLNDALLNHAQKNPLTRPIRSIKVEVLKTRDKKEAQRHFFSKKEDANEKLKDFMSEMAQRYEQKSVYFAQVTQNIAPELAWTPVFIDPAELKSEAVPAQHYPFAKRPYRLLKTPVPLYFASPHERDFFWVGERTHEKYFQTFSIEMTEKLAGNWWDVNQSFNRTYFKVHARSVLKNENFLFWIFRDVTQNWFLQGIFFQSDSFLAKDGSACTPPSKFSPIIPF